MDYTTLLKCSLPRSGFGSQHGDPALSGVENAGIEFLGLCLNELTLTGMFSDKGPFKHAGVIAARQNRERGCV